MAKTLLSMHDLRRRALAEIRQQPGCHNVQDIAINRVIDDRAENNWSLCVLSAGVADANTAARAALYVQSVLRRDYDLMTDSSRGLDGEGAGAAKEIAPATDKNENSRTPGVSNPRNSQRMGIPEIYSAKKDAGNSRSNDALGSRINPQRGHQA